MAQFMNGSELSMSLVNRANYPADAKTIANTKQEVFEKLPLSSRFLGLEIFIEEENKWYAFIDGITDDDFKLSRTISDDIDMSDYYTKEETDALIPSIEGLATEDYVQQAIDGIEHPVVDLSEYYTKEEVDGLIPDISNLATKDEVELKVDKVDGKDLSANDFTDEYRAKLEELENTDISHLATKDELQEAIDGIEHPVVDLSGYYTKEEVDGITGELATKEDLELKVDKVDGKDLSANDFTDEYKAKVDEIEFLATKDELQQAIDSIEHPVVDLSGYYTKEETYSKEEVDGLIPDISNLSTKDELDLKVDKVDGMGLSETSFTQEEKDKLAKLKENEEIFSLKVLQTVLNNVKATQENPYITEIEVFSTDKYDCLPVNVLRLGSDSDDVTTVLAEFTADEVNDFEKNDFVEFDGELKLKKQYDLNADKTQELEFIYVYEVELNLGVFKSIESIEVV